MEYLNIVFQEVYKILFLLVPVLVRFGTYLRVLFRSHFCWRDFVFRRLEFRTRVLLYPRRNLKGTDKFKQEHGLSIALGRGLPIRNAFDLVIFDHSHHRGITE